jgi:hypothetical protein
MTTAADGHTGGADGALLARKTWRTVEPLHGMIYFVAEAADEYAKLGVTGQDGYFASRVAPMGPVSAEVVIATFFNFKPELVRRAIPRTWQIASPTELLDARFRAVDRALRRLLGDEVLQSSEMARAAELARLAAESSIGSIEGRPLCAAHASVPWPEESHLVLWHAQSILREYRGDGHIASLVVHGLSGIDALISHACEGTVPASVLQSTRGWSDEEWSDAITSMRKRGWLTSGPTLAFTEWGAAQRAAIESQTDDLAAGPYVELGESACAELRALARPWSKVLSDEILSRSAFARP